MDRKVFTALLLSILVVGLIVLTFAIFQPFLLALLWAAVIAVVSYGAYRKLLKLFRGRKNLAALVMTLLVFIILLGPFFSLALHFYDDAAYLPRYVEKLLESDWVRDALAWLQEKSGRKLDGKTILAFAEKFLPTGLEAAKDVAGFLFGLLAGIAFVTLSAFYFFRDGPQVVRVLRELLPLSEEDRDTVFEDIHDAIVAAVRGGLATALVQGLLGFIILFILGVDRPVLWAAIMALASFIPMVGTAIVWVPIALWLFFGEDEVAKALVLAGYGVVVIGGSDNLVRPILVGQHMHAHPLLLFFGILGGIVIFGFAGIILGPVAVAFLSVSTRLFRREFGRSGDDAAPA